MKSIINNEARIGNPTSSEIFALTKIKKDGAFDKAALTYIEECNMERRLGRSLTDEVNSRPTTWGKFIEGRAFDILGIEYTLSSTETAVHPVYDFWAGSCDGQKFDDGGTVIDIKCPMTLKSFCTLVDGCYMDIAGREMMERVRNFHKDGEKYYWQLVSNAILTGSKYAELIVYMPYKSELDKIRTIADGNKNCYWIWAASDQELPYLIDGGYYKNLNVIRFEVPESDKEFLTKQIIEAGKKLIARPNLGSILT